MNIDNAWTTIVNISVILGILASVITIGYFVYRVRRRSHSTDRITESSGSGQGTSVKFSVPSASEPTHIPELMQMLKSAKSIPIPSERDAGLQTVAETAVSNGHYDIAIEAGVASAYAQNRSEILYFVAISAAEKGLFPLADKAASNITIPSDRSEAKNKIIQINSNKLN